MLADLFRADLNSNPATLPEEARVQLLVGALMSLVFWWMDYEIPISAADLNGLFQKLASKQ